MPPLRVLRIISRMTIGEAASQVGALLYGLDPDQFEQRLYTGPVEPGEPDYRRLRATDLPIRLLPALRRATRPTDDLRALAALVDAIREFRPDLVHTHDLRAGRLGRIAAVACRVPLRVHSFHEYPVVSGRSPTLTRLALGAERALARTNHALVVVNARVRDELLAARIGRPAQYTVIPPGVSLPPVPDRAEARRRLGLGGPGPVVAYVGPVTAAKRLDRMLSVARAVRRVMPDVHFVVCGTGDRLAATVAAASAADLSVTFLPWRPDVEVVYAAADLVLLTSDREGTPLTLIEAAQAGRPVVATDVGGVAEVVRHGRTGLLCDRADLDGLCRAVLRLLGDADLRRRMGRAAQAEVREVFGTPRLVAATRDLYHRLALARGRRSPVYADRAPALARLP
jgi:Glycosyltransferase